LPPEPRKFAPHVTLARLRDPPLDQLRAAGLRAQRGGVGYVLAGSLPPAAAEAAARALG